MWMEGICRCDPGFAQASSNDVTKFSVSGAPNCESRIFVLGRRVTFQTKKARPFVGKMEKRTRSVRSVFDAGSGTIRHSREGIHAADKQCDLDRPPPVADPGNVQERTLSKVLGENRYGRAQGIAGSPR